MFQNRRGYTLVEAMVVVGIFGTLLAVAVPRLGRSAVERDVSATGSTVVSLYQRARLAAIQRGAPATIQFDNDSVWVTVTRGGTTQQIGPSTDLHGLYGVTVSPPATPIVIQPTGMPMSPATTFVIAYSRAGKADSVVISGYGRIQ